MMRICVFVGILFAASVAMAQSVQLDWNAVTQDIDGNQENIQGYYVSWGTQSGNYTDGFSTGNVTDLQIDDLTNEQTYYFVVRAIDLSNNESDWSNEASYTVPVEDCNNGLDDDHDGLTDCQDVECPANEEVCDQVDNDCDGQTDEDIPGCCTDGQSSPCSTDEGECTAGVQICDANGTWGACDGTLPGAEICDDELDNDCDGETDDDDVCNVPDGGVDGGSDAGSGTDPEIEGGCGCAAAGEGGWLALLPLLVMGLRRRRL
jgi:MYXO-CTERM domain-containing protein